MKSIAQMVRGKIAFDQELLEKNTKTIVAHSGPNLTNLFPRDSLQKPTAALPRIWRDWDQFKLLSDQLQQAAKQLDSAKATDRAALATSFKSIAKTCTGCHKTFRQKKQ